MVQHQVFEGREFARRCDGRQEAQGTPANEHRSQPCNAATRKLNCFKTRTCLFFGETAALVKDKQALVAKVHLRDLFIILHRRHRTLRQHLALMQNSDLARNRAYEIHVMFNDNNRVVLG